MFALAWIDDGMPNVHVLRVGETLVGRTAACDLIINSPTISRKHARIRVVGDRAFLRDSGSTYGTAVNGVPVLDEQEIASGDTLRLGQIEMRLETDAAPGPAKKPVDQTMVMQRGVSLTELEQGTRVGGFDTTSKGFSKKDNNVNKVFIIVAVIVGVVIVVLLLLAASQIRK